MVSVSKRTDSKDKTAVSSWLSDEEDDANIKFLHQAQLRVEAAEQDHEPRRIATHGRKQQSGEARPRSALAITRANKPRIRVAPLKRISVQESNPTRPMGRDNEGSLHFINKDSVMTGQLSAESFVFNDSNIDVISTHSSITNSWAPRIRLYYPPPNIPHKPIENMVITVQKPENECASTRMDDLPISGVMLSSNTSDAGRVSHPRPKLNQLHGLEEADEEVFNSSFLSLALTEEQRAEVEQFVFRAWSSDDDCDDSKVSHTNGKRKSLPSNSNDGNFKQRVKNTPSDVSRKVRTENQEKAPSLTRSLRERTKTASTKEKPSNNYLPGWIFCDPMHSQQLNVDQKDNEIDNQFSLPYLATDDNNEKRQVSFIEESTIHETNETRNQEKVDFKNHQITALEARLENAMSLGESLKHSQKFTRNAMQELNDEIEERIEINQEKYTKMHDRLRALNDTYLSQDGATILPSITCRISLLSTNEEKKSIDEPITSMTRDSNSRENIQKVQCHQGGINDTNDSSCLPLISSIESKDFTIPRFSTSEVNNSSTVICEDCVHVSEMGTAKQNDTVESVTEVASMTSKSIGEISSSHDIDTKKNLSWREIQSEVDAVISRYHSTIAKLDNDLNFEDDFDIFSQHSVYIRDRFKPLRCTMLKDGTLTEKEVASFFAGLSLQSVKVRSLECQVESLKEITRAQLEYHAFSYLRSFFQRNNGNFYEASRFAGSNDFVPKHSYDSATNALLEELENIESKRLKLEKEIVKRVTDILNMTLPQESQVFKPVSQHLREDADPKEGEKTTTPDDLTQFGVNMYKQAFKSHELSFYQDKDPSFTLADSPGNGDASLVDVGIDQSTVGKLDERNDTQGELEGAQNACYLFEENNKKEEGSKIYNLIGRNDWIETPIESSGKLNTLTCSPLGNDIERTDDITVDFELETKQLNYSNLESNEKTLNLSQGKSKTNGQCSFMSKKDSELLPFKHSSRSNKKIGRIKSVESEAKDGETNALVSPNANVVTPETGKKDFWE